MNHIKDWSDDELHAINELGGIVESTIMDGVFAVFKPAENSLRVLEGHGSSFLMRHANHFFIVTARHVVKAVEKSLDAALLANGCVIPFHAFQFYA